MTDHFSLTATNRAEAGKGNARATRREGRVPAVIYGDNKPPVIISLAQNELMKVVNSGHIFTHLCDLDVDGQKHSVLARDVQFHPVKDMPIHVDFLRVTEKTMVTVEVPVRFVNEEKSAGLRRGGILNVALHTIEVTCRADRIPDHLDIDILDLKIGDDVKVAQVKLPAAIKTTLKADETVVTILPPKTAQADEAA